MVPSPGMFLLVTRMREEEARAHGKLLKCEIRPLSQVQNVPTDLPLNPGPCQFCNETDHATTRPNWYENDVIFGVEQRQAVLYALPWSCRVDAPHVRQTTSQTFIQSASATPGPRCVECWQSLLKYYFLAVPAPRTRQHRGFQTLTMPIAAIPLNSE